MRHIIMAYILILTMAAALPYIQPAPAHAQGEGGDDAAAASCAGGDDTDCLLMRLQDEAGKITEQNWRDSTYRELAKLLARQERFKEAFALIEKIVSNDTKAMTVRGIAMAAAELGLPQEKRASIFTALRDEAEKIDHLPSYGIALTYISMAQAFAGDDEEAMATARDLENGALRNKAYGEAAEIQAARGDVEAVLSSLSAIDSTAYRDKACRLISKIFADNAAYDDAIRIQTYIENPYQRSQALLYLLGKQIVPEEVIAP